jgi:hypothetical protein
MEGVAVSVVGGVCAKWSVDDAVQKILGRCGFTAALKKGGRRRRITRPVVLVP